MLKKNIFSNFISSAWIGLIGITFIPYYITLMGAESFALISIFITLVNIMTLIDIGMSQTLNRELAIHSVTNNLRSMRDTIHTLECIYIPMVTLVGVALHYSSSFIANSWLNNNDLTSNEIISSLQIISLIIPLHLLTNFYAAGISGLQHQLPLSIINSIMAALRYAAAVPIMYVFSPTPIVFFLWQLVIGLIHAIVILTFLRGKTRLINHTPELNTVLLKNIRKFSVGVGFTSVLGIILLNMDKIFLSRYISLEEFGYYSVASIIAMNVAPRIASPFFSAFYPKFTQCTQQQDEKQRTNLYHTGATLLALFIIPTSIFISLHAEILLGIWTNDLLIVERTKTILAILTLGCMFNGILYIPYALQLAHGETRISIYANSLSIITFMVLIANLYPNYGIISIAFSWLITNATSTIISVFFMHKSIAKGEFYIWLIHDNTMIFLASLLAGLIIGSTITHYTIMTLVLIFSCMIVAPVITIPHARNLLTTFLQGRTL